MTTAQNSIFYNAAIEGYIAGSLKGRALTAVNGSPPDPTAPPAIATPADPSYAALAAEAVVWAAALDAAIPPDVMGSSQPGGTIFTSAGGGVAAVPSTDATGQTQFAQLTKARLIAALSYAVFSGRYDAQPAQDFNIDSEGTPLPIDYTSLATSTALVYQEAATGIVGAPHPANANNLLLEYGISWGGLAGILAGAPTGSIPDTIFDAAFSFIGELAITAAGTGALAIPFDATISISSSNGMPIAPTGSPSIHQQAEYAKMRLIESITLAYTETRQTASLAAQNPGADLEPAILAWATANAPVITAAYGGLVDGLDFSIASTRKNPTLYNEAYCGFVAAVLGARPFGYGTVGVVNGNNVLVPPFVLPSDDPSYVALLEAAVTFAAVVDATVNASDVVGATVPTGVVTPAITAAGTGAVSPTSGTLQEGQLGKTGLMWGICRASQYGRPLLGDVLDTTASTYTTAAQAIVAAYLELCTALYTP